MLGQFIIAVQSGAIFAAAALGFSLIFGVLEVVNIFHGELIMLGAFTTYWLFKIYHIDPLLSIPLSFLGLLVFGYLLARYIIVRFAGKAHMLSLLLTFGLSLMISNLALVFWKGDYRIVSPSYAGAQITAGGMTISLIRLATFIFAVLVVFGLYVFLQRTEMGRAIRATAQDKESAELVGVRTTHIYAITFAIGAGIAGVSGTLISLLFSIFPAMGYDYLGYSFFCVVIGGMGYIPGVLIGGLVLGFVRTFATYFFTAGIANMVTLFGITLVLAFRPSGILGKGK